MSLIIDQLLDESITWSGFYYYDKHQPYSPPGGVRVCFRKNGARLEGKMIDVDPEAILSYRDLIESAEKDLGDEKMHQLKELVTQYPTLVYERRLPTDSILLGSVKGDRIEFVKTYLGETVTLIHDGQQVFGGGKRPGHDVHYSGTIDVITQTIEGIWIIRKEGPMGAVLTPDASGTFRFTPERPDLIANRASKN
jgi:hypothetical protein